MSCRTTRFNVRTAAGHFNRWIRAIYSFPFTRSWLPRPFYFAIYLFEMALCRSGAALSNENATGRSITHIRFISARPFPSPFVL